MSLKFQTPKDPDEFLDYTIDWTDRMARSDTIDEANVITVGAEVSNVSVSGNVVTVWLSGGNSGSTANVQCTITTSGGRIMQQTVLLKIVDK
jgi:hypothetical protein